MVDKDSNFYITCPHSGKNVVQFVTDERCIIITGMDELPSVRFTSNDDEVPSIKHEPSDKFWDSLAEAVLIVIDMKAHLSEMRRFRVPSHALNLTDYNTLYNPSLPLYEARISVIIMDTLKENLEEHNSLYNNDKHLEAVIERAFEESEEFDKPSYLDY